MDVDVEGVEGRGAYATCVSERGLGSSREGRGAIDGNPFS